ncbi:MAG: TolC family protein [Candidatus Omnitrophica bacterium]|nr:TolC family protein [Candidatus Omnitrophota bacterium]
MKRLMIFILISFVFLGVKEISLAQDQAVLKAEEIPLTLDEAVAIALRDNRDVLLQVEDVKKAKAQISESQASLFPTLNFTGSRTYTTGYYAEDLAQTTTQATLKQYLYKGGEAINTIEQDKYKLKASEALLDKIRLETVLNVEKAFYTLLLAGDFAHLNKAIVENTREHIKVIQARYKNGQASASDILSIQSSLSSTQEAYQDSLNQTEAAGVLLNNLLYLDETTRIRPDAEFTYEPMEIAYDEAFLKAMATRPEIRQYEAETKVDKKAIEIAKADNRPNIYASWDYYSRSHTGTTTSKNWNDYNVVGLTFSWPIFDGWQAKAKVEQAIVDLKETQLTKEKIIKDIALELKESYLSLKNAIAKIEAIEKDLLVYQDNLYTLGQKYKQGQASSLDKDDAELKYKVSLFNQKQAVYDYLIAKSSFDKATGGI